MRRVSDFLDALDDDGLEFLVGHGVVCQQKTASQ